MSSYSTSFLNTMLLSSIGIANFIISLRTLAYAASPVSSIQISFLSPLTRIPHKFVIFQWTPSNCSLCSVTVLLQPLNFCKNLNQVLVEFSSKLLLQNHSYWCKIPTIPFKKGLYSVNINKNCFYIVLLAQPHQLEIIFSFSKFTLVRLQH